MGDSGRDTAEEAREHSTGLSAVADAALWASAALLGQLPLAAQRRLGRLLGRIALRLAPRRRRIAERNLELCFPDASTEARRRLLVRNFEATGMALVESATAWTRDPRTLAGRVDVIGGARLEAALAAPEGVLLLGCHLVPLEICGAFLGLIADVDAVQRRGGDGPLDRLRRRGRRRHFGGLVDRDDVRALIRRLRAGRCVWYAFDQDPGPDRGVFAPFFGVPAATPDAAPRIAAAAGARLLFLDHWREPGTDRWTLRFRPVPDGLPSDDAAADTRRLVALVEDAVRAHPEQYLWTHRRFKTRPAGEAGPYD